MSQSAFKVEIDISRIERLGEALGGIDAGSLGEASMRAVNTVADETYDLARPRMLATINLTDTYVRDRMTVNHATNPNNVSASIVASGARNDMTILARYGARQLVQPVKHPARSRGDQFYSRNIAPGMKAAGISVEVTRGARKPITNAFFMPLRNVGTVGLFTREGKGDKNYKHRYGPSVYQLFRTTARNMIDEVTDNLENTLVEEVNNHMKAVLK